MQLNYHRTLYLYDSLLTKRANIQAAALASIEFLAHLSKLRCAIGIESDKCDHSHPINVQMPPPRHSSLLPDWLSTKGVFRIMWPLSAPPPRHLSSTNSCSLTDWGPRRSANIMWSLLAQPTQHVSSATPRPPLAPYLPERRRSGQEGSRGGARGDGRWGGVGGCWVHFRCLISP